MLETEAEFGCHIKQSKLGFFPEIFTVVLLIHVWLYCKTRKLNMLEIVAKSMLEIVAKSFKTIAN